MESDIFLFRNPASGLEYNSICDHPRLSGYLYTVDVARHPNVIKDLYDVIKDLGCSANVTLKVEKINFNRQKVETRVAKHFSRRMM